MKLTKTITAIALVSLFPMSAVAQSATSFNNDGGIVDSGAQMNNSIKRDYEPYSASLFGFTKKQKKQARARYRQSLKMASARAVEQPRETEIAAAAQEVYAGNRSEISAEVQ